MVAVPILILMVVMGPFDRPNPGVEQGNRLMKDGKFNEALKKYEGEEKRLKDKPELSYNKGLAQYNKKDFPKAREEMARSLKISDTQAKQNAFYNLGNNAFRMENYSDAVEAFKEALLLNPSDMDAKINLELAMKKMKEKEQKKSQEEPKESQEKEKKNETKEKDQPQPGSISKEEALQVLNSLMKQNINLQPQKNMLKEKGVPLVDKDW